MSDYGCWGYAEYRLDASASSVISSEIPAERKNGLGKGLPECKFDRHCQRVTSIMEYFSGAR